MTSECFRLASELSVQVNIQLLDKPIRKAVVYLDPGRVPQHLAGKQGHLPHPDGAGGWRRPDRARSRGEAVWRRPYHRPHDSQVRLSWHPGHARKGETIILIWRPSLAPPPISSTALRKAAFNITYCPGGLSREETEGVGFGYADLASTDRALQPGKTARRLQHRRW